MPHQRDRILILDGDQASRAVLDALFDMHGFDVFSTDTVLGASSLIASFRPNVILLDLALPYRSGASLLSQVKANPDTGSIPVVILTAVPDMLPVERQQQAAAIIRKPFSTRALVDTVRAVCVRRLVMAGPVRIDSASIQRLESL